MGCSPKDVPARPVEGAADVKNVVGVDEDPGARVDGAPFVVKIPVVPDVPVSEGREEDGVDPGVLEDGEPFIAIEPTGLDVEEVGPDSPGDVLPADGEPDDAKMVVPGPRSSMKSDAEGSGAGPRGAGSAAGAAALDVPGLEKGDDVIAMLT